MLKNAIAIALLSAASVAVHAAGGYAGVTLNQFGGQGGGYTNTATSGGSQANTGSYGQGSAQMHSANDGSTYAHAGANVTPTGANSYTSGGSTSNATSNSYTTGLGNGQTTGGTGQDYTASAWSNFGAQAGGFTGSLHFGGF